MKKAIKFMAFSLVAATLISMAACTAKTPAASSNGSAADNSTAQQTTVDKIKASGSITMSTNAEFEPFEYKDGGNYAGIDVEISQNIAKKLGVTLKINDVAFDSLIPELQSGKANFVAAGMTVTDDRKKNVDFSDTYFKAAQAIIVRKGSDIKKPADLAGKVVGVQQGTTGDSYCTDEDKKNNVNVKSVQRYNKGVDAITDLINGKVDAVVIDDFPAQKFVSKNSAKLEKLSDALTVEEYAIAVKKGDTETLKVINDVLSEMKSSGDMDKLIQKFKSQLEG